MTMVLLTIGWELIDGAIFYRDIVVPEELLPSLKDR